MGGSQLVQGHTLDNKRAPMRMSTPADALAAQLMQVQASFGQLFNETTFDRQRGNTDLTVLASAARVATLNSSDFVNYNSRGLHVIIDVTVDPASASIVAKIEGKDVLSGKYYTILEAAAIAAVGTTVLKVFPGITAAANLSASDIIPRTWRVTVTHADSDSLTYSIGASLIL